ncbi:MAG: peptidylprolyl isomerase [Proteobacteria bacterium]|nr:peptidylprolyl isomerase [Pseudomonadota bacterium]
MSSSFGTPVGAARRARCVTVALALALGAAAASAQTVGDAIKSGAGKDDPIVARVNGVEIHRSDVLHALETMPPQVQQMPMTQVYPLLLERLIDGKLVIGAGRAQKLQDDGEIKRKVADFESRAIQEAYLSRAVTGKVTDGVLRKKYETFINDNPPQEEVRARHILVTSEKAAQDALAELKKGTDFATVARAKSTDGSARDGGDLGYFSRGDMVAEFSDAAFAMKAGEISKTPVKSQFGWHLIKVEDRRVSPAPSFEETKEQLRTELSQELVGEVVEDLRTKAKIERFGLDGKPLAPTK